MNLSALAQVQIRHVSWVVLKERNWCATKIYTTRRAQWDSPKMEHAAWKMFCCWVSWPQQDWTWKSKLEMLRCMQTPSHSLLWLPTWWGTPGVEKHPRLKVKSLKLQQSSPWRSGKEIRNWKLVLLYTRYEAAFCSRPACFSLTHTMLRFCRNTISREEEYIIGQLKGCH